MAIESVGAASTNAVNTVTQQSQQPQPSQKPQQAEQSVQPQATNEGFQKQAKEAQELSAEKLEAAVSRLNEMMESSQRSLNFSVDNTSEQVVVQVRDLSTDTVIRQIPNEEALRFAESFDRMMGLIFISYVVNCFRWESCNG